jgi:hypothetical protein
LAFVLAAFGPRGKPRRPIYFFLLVDGEGRAEVGGTWRITERGGRGEIWSSNFY